MGNLSFLVKNVDKLLAGLVEKKQAVPYKGTLAFI
jgi:hypothetical protein